MYTINQINLQSYTLTLCDSSLFIVQDFSPCVGSGELHRAHLQVVRKPFGVADKLQVLAGRTHPSAFATIGTLYHPAGSPKRRSILFFSVLANREFGCRIDWSFDPSGKDCLLNNPSLLCRCLISKKLGAKPTECLLRIKELLLSNLLTQLNQQHPLNSNCELAALGIAKTCWVWGHVILGQTTQQFGGFEFRSLPLRINGLQTPRQREVGNLK